MINANPENTIMFLVPLKGFARRAIPPKINAIAKKISNKLYKSFFLNKKISCLNFTIPSTRKKIPTIVDKSCNTIPGFSKMNSPIAMIIIEYTRTISAPAALP